MITQEFEQRTRELIDSLKAICAHYGLGNDGNEFKIITQVFLFVTHVIAQQHFRVASVNDMMKALQN